MRYTGIELFLKKLEHMIFSNDNPLINNHPLILSEKPQFQLLYQELLYIIQTPLFMDERHELQQVTDLKKRLKDAAEDAEDIIDLYVYNINFGEKITLNQISLNRPPPTYPKRIKEGGLVWHNWFAKLVKKKTYLLNLKDVIRSITFIKEELIMIIDNMKMDSSPETDSMKTKSAAAAAGTSSTSNPKGTKQVLEEIVVGFDRPAELIRDKLAEDQKRLDVISIVGMGGVGKTTLATKVFNDPFIVYHFRVRGWVTVSQTYDKRDLIIQILDSIGIQPDTGSYSTVSQLRAILHKSLIDKRYLIVIDDIWSTQAWDDMKLFFRCDNIGSRILLTCRHKEVALHAKSHGFIHQLECLGEDESWELLRKKVFHGRNDCPKSLIKPGMKIARNCHGLPLTLIVVAGVLAKQAVSKDAWERIGQSVSSYIVNDQTGHIEKLALSFDHLPGHLRDCFLYLGGFPEDYKFRVQQTIWLWMAEGFIQEDGCRSLEEIGEDYLMELVDRNLIVVLGRKFNGGIKTFYVHDLLRELCLEIARKESFCMKTRRPLHSVVPYKQRRVFIEHNIRITDSPMIRSLLCVYSYTSTRKVISEWSHFWKLLMVLDLRGRVLDYFPEEISLSVHLRYLGLSYRGYDFPPSICNLWSLQTLIFYNRTSDFLKLPNTISNLVNLRHLQCDRFFSFPPIQKPMYLQTILRLELGDDGDVIYLVKCFPGIKKLSCFLHPDMEYDFKSLTFLEDLKLEKPYYPTSKLKFQKDHNGFPTSLKTLTLECCFLPWSDMSIIQSLPNLEVLKLLTNSFVGRRWDAGEEQFQQLKCLKLIDLDIEEWEASDINFPCLKQLVVHHCCNLEEIPSEIGYIPTLELIHISRCKDSAVESLDTLQEEQHAQGNFELKIRGNGRQKRYHL